MGTFVIYIDDMHEKKLSEHVAKEHAYAKQNSIKPRSQAKILQNLIYITLDAV